MAVSCAYIVVCPYENYQELLPCFWALYVHFRAYNGCRWEIKLTVQSFYSEPLFLRTPGQCGNITSSLVSQQGEVVCGQGVGVRGLWGTGACQGVYPVAVTHIISYPLFLKASSSTGLGAVRCLCASWTQLGSTGGGGEPVGVPAWGGSGFGHNH